MTTNPSIGNSGQATGEAVKSWTMVVLTFIFVLLYGAALIGWLKPQSDASMITRLEPIIFVIIGYYFGRLPAQQNEKTLKNEIDRQTQKADAAQHAKETALQTRQALEEKVKNVGAALVYAPTRGGRSESSSPINAETERALPHVVGTALKILNS